MAFGGTSGPLLAGLGVYADLGKSFGLKVKPPSPSTEGNHDASLTTLGGGVVWRVQPVKSSGFVLAPALGYRSLQLVTSDKGGVHLDGLPDAKLSGFALRLDAEAPLNERLAILAGGGYTLWTSAKDLVKGGYFGKGSARGLEFEAGVGYRLVGPLSVRGLIEYQSQSYSSLGDVQAGLGTASGAKDAYLGGRAMLRAAF
jgi:hypothetical protein